MFTHINYLRILLVVMIASALSTLSLMGWHTLTMTTAIVIGSIMFVVALWRPYSVFLLLLAVIPLEIVIITIDGTPFALRLYQYLGGILMLAVGLRFIVGRLDHMRETMHYADKAFLLLVVVGFVSVFMTGTGGSGLRHAIIFASFFLVYFLTRVFVQSWDEITEALTTILASGLLVTLYGIVQNWFFVHGEPFFSLMPGRPHATFAEADWFGMFLVMLSAIVYFFLYYNAHGRADGTQTQKPPWAHNTHKNITHPQKGMSVLYYGILLIIYVALILTVARSAWLGAIAVVITYLFVTAKRFGKKTLIKNLSIIGLIILVAYSIVVFFHLSTFALANRALSTTSGMQTITIACDHNRPLPASITHMDDLKQYGCVHINLEDIDAQKAAGAFVREIDRPDPNINLRRHIYKKAFQKVKAKPLLGYGWGSSGRLLGSDPSGTPLNTSNVFLEVALSVGVVGLGLFLSLLGFMLYRAVRLSRESLLATRDTRGVGVLLFLVALLIPNLFNAGLLMGYVWVIFGLLSAMIVQKKS